MRKLTRSASLLLALLTALSAVGCGGTTTPADTIASGEDTTPVETEPEYNYPDVDYGGYTFKVLNLDEFYSCYTKVDVQEQTGETVDDAVYNRNRRIEERFNIKIKEINEHFGAWAEGVKPSDSLIKSVLADDDMYDCAYCLLSFKPAIVTDGYLADLNAIPELQLGEVWWDNYLNDALELNGKLYTATSPLQLTSLGLSWVFLFNKDMFDSLKLEYPYDLVRDGKWTFDKLNEYVTKIANLNGEDSFTYKEGSNAVYGIAGHTTAPYLAILATDNCFIRKNDKGEQVYVGGTDRLYNALDKIKRAFNVAEGKILYNAADKLTDSATGGYYYMFYTGKAGFLTTELKGTQVMREMTADYGILPTPKYDEAQENYITYASENIGRLCIPKTNDDLTRTGVILDALSYESYKNVLPLYYNQTISQKGLRDEDSIEMLDIINRGRMTEIGLIYGTTTDLINSLKTMITNGDDTAASIVASNDQKCKDNLAKLLESVQ